MHKWSLMINRRARALIVVVVYSIVSLAPAQAEEPPEWLALTVTPAAEPTPALRHRFLPTSLDKTSGNAAPMYFRAMLQVGSNPRWQGEGDEPGHAHRVVEWQRMPIDELPIDEVRRVLSGYDLWMVDRAALYDRCEWETDARGQGVAALLPELGQMRKFARLISLRARVQIREHDHAGAIDSLRTGFTMASHVAEGNEMLIGRLVGISITVMMSETTREMIASPGSPNLYWALAKLEAAAIETRPAIEFERYLIHWSFPALRELSDVPMSVEQADHLWDEVFSSEMVGFLGGRITWEHPLPALGIGIVVYSQAKSQLAEHRYDAEAVEAMPVKQVLLLHWMVELEHWADELFKWHYLPYVDAWQGERRAERAFEQYRSRTGETNVFLRILPALGAVRASEERMRRRLALLRCVEAIRMHAAHNDGQLPASLDEITVVPAPRDPSNNRPFRYERQEDGRTFTLAPEQIEGTRLPVRSKEDHLRVTIEPHDQ